jgi:hypothetical protein
MPRVVALSTFAYCGRHMSGNAAAIWDGLGASLGSMFRHVIDLGRKLNVVLLIEASFQLVNQMGDCCRTACFVHFLSDLYFAHDFVECVLPHSPRQLDTQQARENVTKCYLRVLALGASVRKLSRKSARMM